MKILEDFAGTTGGARTMRYNEIEARDALGLPNWRHLRKEHVLRLLSMMPDMDTEVALRIVEQLPELGVLAQELLNDAASAHEATLRSNEQSMGMVYAVAMERLVLLRRELGRDDLSPEIRLQLLSEVRQVHDAAAAKDTENKQFIAAQLDKRLWVAAACATAVVLTVVGAARSSTARSLLGAAA
jgi:hypothetical protein